MSDMEKEVQLVIASESVTNSGSPLSNREIERVRRYQTNNWNQNEAGTMSNVAWTLLARSDGTGQFDLTFTQLVKWRVIQGKTTIALLDEAGAVVARWDTPFWRQCGSSTLTFSQPISADIAIKTVVPSFEIDATIQRC